MEEQSSHKRNIFWIVVIYFVLVRFFNWRKRRIETATPLS